MQGLVGAPAKTDPTDDAEVEKMVNTALEELSQKPGSRKYG